MGILVTSAKLVQVKTCLEVNMGKTKKALVFVLLSLLIAAPLFANGASESGDDVVTIRFEQFSGSDGTGSGEALRQMIAVFEEQNPDIKVELQTIGYDDYFTQLQSKVVGSNTADVFELNYENFVSYASQGVLADISGYLGDTGGFNQTALEAFNYNGIQYGVFSTVCPIPSQTAFFSTTRTSLTRQVSHIRQMTGHGVMSRLPQSR